MGYSEINLDGICGHCGQSDGAHWPGCIMDALSFLIDDEGETIDVLSNVEDVRGLFNG